MSNERRRTARTRGIADAPAHLATMLTIPRTISGGRVDVFDRLTWLISVDAYRTVQEMVASGWTAHDARAAVGEDYKAWLLASFGSAVEFAVELHAELAP